MPLSYDALYALSHPEMASAAAKVLAKHPGLEGVLERVIAEARGSNSNAARNFTVLLAAFDRSLVDRAIAKALGDPETGAVAELLRSYLNGYSRGGNGNELFVAGYASDTIDVGDDRLGIQEDVQTLTAVMLAKEVKPPLAIGLFGDWGSGKSFFMQSLRAAGDALAKRAQDSDKSPFCSEHCSDRVQRMALRRYKSLCEPRQLHPRKAGGPCDPAVQARRTASRAPEGIGKYEDSRRGSGSGEEACPRIDRRPPG